MKALFHALTVAVPSLIASLALAAPGDLDPTFGNGGRVSIAVEGRYASILSVIQQADGRIVLAGLVTGLDFVDSTQLLLIRLDPDGALDTSFDSDGMVIGGQPNERASVVIQQSDGKLVVAGRDSETANMMLWRFESNGTLDPSFGDSGSVAFASGEADYPGGLIQQSSGKLVVAGTVGGSGGSVREMMMVRFNGDGQLDTSFGGNGTVVADFQRGAMASPGDLIQQPDGKLVMAGGRAVSVQNSRGGTVGVVRTTADGHLEFMRDVFLDFYSSEGSFVHASRSRVALQDDGKIVVNGMVGADGASSGFVFRLDRDGVLDPAFGTSGIVFSGGSFHDAMADIAIQADGKIVTAGSQRVSASTNYWLHQDLRLRQFLPNGEIDTSFGADGTTIADFQDAIPWVAARAMTRQADGKLIVVGDADFAQGNRPGLAVPRLAVARFVNNDRDFAGLVGLIAGKILVTAGEGTAEVAVRRTGGSTGAVSVAFETVDGSAQAGLDYVRRTGRLEWADGDGSQKWISVELVDDGNQAQEQFSVRLKDPVGGTMVALDTNTIWAGDIPVVGFTSDRTLIGEADDSLNLVVARTGSASGALSVDFETYEIAARAGSDFATVYGTLTWEDGDLSEKTIAVPIMDDDAVEGDEWFGVYLSNPSAGGITGGEDLDLNMTVTIVDEEADSSPPPPSGGGSGGGNGGDGAAPPSGGGSGGGNGGDGAAPPSLGGSGGGNGGGGAAGLLSVLLLGFARLLQSLAGRPRSSRVRAG
jgi:uncharacterized delta-60 repeat protein